MQVGVAAAGLLLVGVCRVHGVRCSGIHVGGARNTVRELGMYERLGICVGGGLVHFNDGDT